MASPASAEPVPSGGPVQTRAGVAEVFEDAEVQAQRLRLGETVLFQDGAARYVWLVEQRGDLLLVGVSNGGTGCPALFTWVHTVPGEVRMVEPYFGNCSDIVEVSHDAETVTVAMPSESGAEGFVGYVYDGDTVRQVTLGQRPSVSGPTAGAAPWEGRYPAEVFRGSDWRPVLVDLMGEAAYVRASGLVGQGAPMERQGRWIVGEGWARFDAQGGRVGIGMSLEDGRMLVVMRVDGDTRAWGDPGGDWPPLLREMMREG